jgi:hypothetical protein
MAYFAFHFSIIPASDDQNNYPPGYPQITVYAPTKRDARLMASEQLEKGESLGGEIKPLLTFKK